MNRVLLTLLLGLVAALPAQATAYTYSATLDLSSATISNLPGGGGGTLTFTFPGGQPTFPLSVGDTLSGTLTFDQAVTVTPTNPGPSSGNFHFYLTAASATNNSSSDEVQLDGVSSTPLSDNPTSGTSSGGGYGITWGGEISTATFSFTGLTYSMTVTSSNANGTAYSPSSLSFMTNFGNLSLTTTPEPNPLDLFGAGLAAVLLLRWARRGRPAQA
jgi:hypothetical protein